MRSEADAAGVNSPLPPVSFGGDAPSPTLAIGDTDRRLSHGSRSDDNSGERLPLVGSINNNNNYKSDDGGDGDCEEDPFRSLSFRLKVTGGAKKAPSPPLVTRGRSGEVALWRRKIKMLVRIKHLALESAASRCGRADRVATALSVAGLAGTSLAAFLLLLYFTSYAFRSDFSVMYEEYSDPLCEQSPTAPMPRRIFAVPPGTVSCTAVQTHGEAVGAAYAVGKCFGTASSGYSAVFKTGPTLHACRAAEEISFANGACVPLHSVALGLLGGGGDASDSEEANVGVGDRNVYVKLTCSDAWRVEDRMGQMAAITSRADAFVPGELLSPSPRTSPSTVALSTSMNTRHTWPFVTGRDLRTASALVPAVVASVASATADDDDPTIAASIVDDPRRLITQSPHCTFDPNATAECAAAAEQSLAKSLRSEGALNSELLRHYSPPSTLAAPVGHLFGGYGRGASAAAPSPSAIAAGAQRYYAVHRSPFDMGAYFPSSDATASGDLNDDEGYAISLWLRADPTTRGFAYAVTDAFEDVETHAVPTLDRLAEVIAGGGGGSRWFPDTYSVYHSLYVDGPARSLSFAYASAPAAESTSTTKEKTTQQKAQLKTVIATIPVLLLLQLHLPHLPMRSLCSPLT